MNISKTFSTACAGLLAVAFSASTAVAAPVFSMVTLGAGQTSPFALEDFGTSATAGFVSNAPLTLSTGVNVTFTGSAGIYSGDVPSVTASPFSIPFTGGQPNNNYLNVRPGGSIVMDYGSNSYTAFNMLWGSINTGTNTANLLSFTFGEGSAAQTVSGKDIANASFGTVSFASNVALLISNLDPFTKLTITATQIAFEFLPGRAVPEPGSLALLGLGLAGLAAVARRKSKQA